MDLIHIIGGGDAALMSALLHLRLGFDVCIYEASDRDNNKENDEHGLTCLRKSASGFWIRQHAGGEYPTDKETALQLLHSCVAMIRVMPNAVYEQAGVQYMITKTAEDEAVRTVKAQAATAAALIDEYRELCGHADWCNVLGAPEEFIHKIAAEDKFAGGVGIKERCVNPIIMTQVLFDKLKMYADQGKLTIHPHHRAVEMKRIQTGHFEVTFKVDNELVERTLLGTVLNCAGYGAYHIMSQLDNKYAQGMEFDVHIRMMGVADISAVEDQDRPKIATFPMGPVHQATREQDINCGMFSSINKNLAYVYGPSEKVSYAPIVGDSTALTVRLNQQHTQAPEEFLDRIRAYPQQDKEQRMAELNRRMHFTYGQLSNAQIVDLLPAPLVVLRKGSHLAASIVDEQEEGGMKSVDPYDHLQKRRREGIVGTLDTQHNILEKATHSVLNGFESVQHTLRSMVHRGVVSKEEAQRKMQLIYEGELDQSIAVWHIKADALYSDDEKDRYSRVFTEDAEYAQETLALALDRYGSHVGRKIIRQLRAQ